MPRAFVIALAVGSVVACLLATPTTLLAPPTASPVPPDASHAFLSDGSSSTSPTLTISSPQVTYLGRFGVMASISGSLIAVGAKCDTVDGFTCAGTAYVYNADTGAMVSNLTNPDPQVNGVFGWCVAINGTTVVVGASGDSAGGFASAGRAYIFNATTGHLLRTLTSPKAQADGQFGYPVAIRGSTVLVGATGESVKGRSGAGRVYAFDATTGARLFTLTSPNAIVNGSFGYSLAASDSQFAVGAPGESVSGLSLAGRVYVYNLESGARLLSLKSPSAQVDGSFGWGVGIDGSRVVVGAFRENASGFWQGGHAYVFNSSSGATLYQLTSPNVQTHGQFGGTVAVNGSLVLVGADCQNNTAGNTYVFDTSDGILVHGLTDPNLQPGGDFGWWVALTSSKIVVTAPFEYVSGVYASGNVYVYARA